MSASQKKQSDDRPVEFSASHGFAAFLKSIQASLAFTSYQSATLYLVGLNPQNGLNIHQARMRKPMGIEANNDGFVLSTATGIEQFGNGLKPGELANGMFDACFVPRRISVTGLLDAHDVGILADGTPIFANTRFNCLACPDDNHSFKVFWKPEFISSIVDEDRCHLNGLAMRDQKPCFVTAISKSDVIDGWRDRRRDGGIVVDVETNDIYCSGLSMPHSPRWHEGRLWLLNSGNGELGYIEDNKFVSVTFCPGFARGLAFVGHYAIVGLSKPRYKRFEGLGLDDALKAKDTEPWCGIQVIDCNKGSCVEWLRIDGALSEIYDLAVLNDTKTPMAIGSQSKEIENLLTFRS